MFIIEFLKTINFKAFLLMINIYQIRGIILKFMINNNLNNNNVIYICIIYIHNILELLF